MVGSVASISETARPETLLVEPKFTATWAGALAVPCELTAV